LTDEVHLAIDSKIAELDQIAKTTKNNLEKQYLRERISKLSGGVSIIKVGSIIESELQEKIDRVDDAVCAVRSAKEEGVLAGGGVALGDASFRLNLDAVSTWALLSPLNKILENANSSDKYELKAYPIGYDVKNFKEVNMIEAGIVDSNKAIKNALINAVSASNTLIMTDYVVCNKRGTYGTVKECFCFLCREVHLR